MSFIGRTKVKDKSYFRIQFNFDIFRNFLEDNIHFERPKTPFSKKIET